MSEDVGVEHGAEKRHGDVRGHEGHCRASDVDLLRSEATGEDRARIRREEEPRDKGDDTDDGVERQIDTIETANIAIIPMGPFLSVEPDVRLGEAEGEQRQREDERVTGLVHAVIRLPHEG